MSANCKTCKRELPKKELPEGAKEALKVMGERFDGGGTFYYTLQGVDCEDYNSKGLSKDRRDVLGEACCEYDEAISRAYQAFGKLALASGVPRDEVDDFTIGDDVPEQDFEWREKAELEELTGEDDDE